MALIAALESIPTVCATPLASFAFGAFLHRPWVVLLGCAALSLCSMLILWTCVHHEGPVDLNEMEPDQLHDGAPPHEGQARATSSINVDELRVRRAERTERLLS